MIREIDDICGFPFAGYAAQVDAMRGSGINDHVPVFYPQRIAEDFVEGESVLVQGKVQTMKNFETGRTKVFVLAEFIASAPYPLRQDDVALRGKIAHETVLRETPYGKMVADVFLRVDNAITGGVSCIPCICWNKKAREAKGWNPGDTVILSGRFQSRTYEKLIDREKRIWEKRMAFEISCHTIERVEEAQPDV
jgi:hypothetical protein